MKLMELPEVLRSRADELAGYSPPAAKAFAEAAELAERALTDSALEPLDLDGAEVESGYTRAHLRRLLAEKRVPNAGTREDPRILRGHLPKKPGHGIVVGRSRPAPTRAQVARQVAGGVG